MTERKRPNQTRYIGWIFGALGGIFLFTSIALTAYTAYLGTTEVEFHGPTQLRRTVISHSLLGDFPKGEAVALPSIRLTEAEDLVTRKVHSVEYGGKGDKKHLGGFTEIDLHGISPDVWKYMISYFGVKSILDVGCGRGISTAWFDLHGVKAICVEGSHDAIEKTMIPNAGPTKLIEHDFSRGPWWPSETVDAVWCVEFLEHVGRNFHKNFIPAFRKAALIFATHSHWGGWHHVEVHKNEWWLNKMESYGFRYSTTLTEMVRKIAHDEMQKKSFSPTGKPYNAQHLYLTMQVFINPVVAVLPAHEHLFAEHGCFGPKGDQVECKEEQGLSPLPKSFYPLDITEEMDEAWVNLVESNIKITQ
jgi:SAM-dependent methyltransferase